MVFLHKGDTYEVSRQFDKKSKTKDMVRITKNRMPFELPEGQELGEALLGIDENAFRRVCFIDDNGLDFSTESIAGKLGGLAGDFDAKQVEDVLGRLLTAIKEIKPLRGNGGTLGVAEERLAQANNRIGELQGVQNQLTNAQKEYHEALDRLEEVRGQLKSAGEVALNEERKKTASSLLEDLRRKQNNRQEILDCYPKGIPDESEASQAKEAVLVQRDYAAGKADLNAGEQETLKQFSIRFINGVPTQEQVKKKNEEIARLGLLQSSDSSGTKANAAERDIVARYSANPPKEAEITEMKEKLAQYKDVSREYENTDATLLTTSIVKFNWPKHYLILLCAGIGFMIAGIALCFLLLWLGIVFLGVGAVLFGIGLFFTLRKSKKPEERAINPKKQQLGAQKDELRKKIATWLSQFYITDPDPISGMAKFESEYGIYVSHLRTSENEEAGQKKKEGEIEELKRTVDAFFASYGYMEGDYSDRLLCLQSDISSFDGLRIRKDKEEQSEKDRREKLTSAKEQTKLFRLKYEIQADADLTAYLSRLEKERITLSHLEKDIEDAKKKYEDYLEENPIAEDSLSGASPDELREEEKSLNEKIAKWKNFIADCENQLEELDELLHSQEELREEIERLKSRHKVLSAVRCSMEFAEDTIKEKYVGPIKKEFERYSELIRKASGLTIELDTNLELTYLNHGEYRKSLHLSDGERMLVSFCLRLALLENMFKGEEVIAILDDPFVSLDDNNLPKVLQSLENLGKSIQVLYFTCSKTRLPKQKA